MNNPKDYLGDATLEKMKGTKWYVLANFIGELLYNGNDAPDPSYPSTKRFVTSERVYVGEKVPAYIKIPGHEGSYLDTEKGLLEIMHECERMAIKEVT